MVKDANQLPTTASDPLPVTASAPAANTVGISNNPSFDELPADLKYFLHTHEDQCRAWVRTHGNTQFPIVKNEQTGLWVWINRADRRRIRRFGNKNGPRL